MSDSLFDAYSSYYDLLYSDKNYENESNYIQHLLKKHGINHGNILEYGSGTGKHACFLVESGYCVHGIELSEEMVAKAQRADGFTCQQGDICTVRLGKKFDAVVSLFHVISYQTSNKAIKAVFERAAEHLNSGGIFLFDFWYTPAVYSQRPSVRVKRMVDTKIEITRIAEPRIYENENRVDVHYSIYSRDLANGTIKKITETHPMRHFSLPEIDLLANEYGFERVDVEEFLTRKPPSENSWGVCVTLQRI
jgi:SAM-dependent methyltransferase